ELAGDRLPLCFVEGHQETPVGEAARERQLVDRREARTESGNLLRVVLGQRWEDTVESAECLVAVAGDRLPDAFALTLVPRPPPLGDVPIPVSHQHVDQPGTQVRAR